MHPVFFEWDTPAILSSFLPDKITIYSYGFMIALGTLLAYWHTAYYSKKQYNVKISQTADLVIILIIAAFVGGKALFFLEDPLRYLESPKDIFAGFENGFVFFGSLLFCIPAMLWFFKKHQLPVTGMLDIMALTTCIVHFFGRLGCFFAGCCYGLPTDSALAITFTDPRSHARPLNEALHPSQLYSVFFLGMIILFLGIYRAKKKFDGQIFLLYLMIYSFGRMFLEEFRGDYKRGFLFNGLITHSQLISLLVILAVFCVYIWLYKKSLRKNN
ncbi:prolipoprotein diacylglyceryl transferase [Chondrinema litorale]|uniref:prolipoprotein diacylglyceryl transferase n=1 Tax=Chondrinema litorale TaxID=2994555 RepID=UPI00254494A5|nr:prolipoprotein diacylglyceryl transferase [Chondrinema litorale]UZR95152.1 prolipoprotein diacylglyceryl transferase [Chondrinema litorale]